jgi:hypothetical protein
MDAVRRRIEGQWIVRDISNTILPSGKGPWTASPHFVPRGGEHGNEALASRSQAAHCWGNEALEPVTHVGILYVPRGNHVNNCAWYHCVVVRRGKNFSLMIRALMQIQARAVLALPG